MSTTRQIPDCSNLLNQPTAAGQLVSGCSRAAIMAGLLLLLPAARAQQVNTVAPLAPYVYVAAVVNSDSYSNNTVRVIISGGSNPVHISFPNLPGGVTASLLAPHDTNGFTASTTFAYKLACTNVAKGTYPLTIRATDGTTTADGTIQLVVANAWVASPTATTNWSTGPNWATSAAPTNGDDVFFFQEHGTTNSYLDTSLQLNSYCNFLKTSSSTNFTWLAPGVSLSITGAPGFTVGADGLPRGITGAGSAQDNKVVSHVFMGTGGATLSVNNENAIFDVESINTGNSGTVLDLSGLDNLSLNVSRVVVGDSSYATAGPFGTEMVRFCLLARTNVICASYIGDYATDDLITNAISFFSEYGSGGNGQWSDARLGIYNEIYADSLMVAQQASGGDPTFLRFNPAFLGSNCVAYFRGVDGGRMSLVGVGVDSGTNASPTTRTRGFADFSGGTVDMLVDRIWLGRTRYNFNNDNQQIGRLIFNRGVVDVNTLIAGYRAYASSNRACEGIVVVSSNAATLVVNDRLILGYTPPGTNYAGTQPSGAPNYGQLFITNSGTVRVKSVACGEMSTNFIAMRTGARLFVTNTICDENIRLSALDMSDSVLAVPGTLGSPKVYVTNLVMGGAGNTIKLTSVEGLTSFPADVPVISWLNRTPTSQNFKTDVSSLPAGYSAYVVDDVANNMIYVRVSTNPPRTLYWRGYVNAQWDTGSSNWLDAATSAQTTFANGDNAVFDDTAGVPTMISVTDEVTPGQSSATPGIAVSNSVNAFTLTGAGGILGSAQFVKQGTASLVLDNYGEYSLLASGGLVTLTPAASIGGVSVSSNVTLHCAGVVAGALNTSGTVTNAGTVNGGVTLLAGALTNAGTINGVLSVGTSTVLHNLSPGLLNNFGNVTFPTNSLLVNDGTLTGGAITIAGTFINRSTAEITLSTSLTIGDKGNFIPDGDTIGTLRIGGQGTDNNAGRIIFGTGSTNFFKVNLANAFNTKILAARHSFGPNQNTKQVNGGTFVISNIGDTAFQAGQSIKLFGNSINDGDVFDAGLNTTNAYPVMSPAAPGPGLAWDLSNLIPGGVIGVRAVDATPINLGVLNEPLVTVSTNVPPVTNNYIVSTFSWPANHIGWKLLSQRNELNVGMSTNWTVVAESLFTNQVVITNAVSSGAGFYRMVYP